MARSSAQVSAQVQRLGEEAAEQVRKTQEDGMAQVKETLSEKLSDAIGSIQQNMPEYVMQALRNLVRQRGAMRIGDGEQGVLQLMLGDEDSARAWEVEECEWQKEEEAAWGAPRIEEDDAWQGESAEAEHEEEGSVEAADTKDERPAMEEATEMSVDRSRDDDVRKPQRRASDQPRARTTPRQKSRRRSRSRHHSHRRSRSRHHHSRRRSRARPNRSRSRRPRASTGEGRRGRDHLPCSCPPLPRRPPATSRTERGRKDRH